MYYKRITERIDSSNTEIRSIIKVRYSLFHILSVQFNSTANLLYPPPVLTSSLISTISEYT